MISVYHSHKFKGMLATGALGVMLVMAMGVFPSPIDASMNSVVSIYVDNDKQVVRTDAETVGEALERAEIVLSEHDLVEPALDEEITNQIFNINVYRAVSVLIVDNDEEYRIESAYGSARLIAENSGVVELYDEDRVEVELVQNFLEENHIGYKLTVERAVPISLKIGDKTTTVRTHADTVGEMFEEAGIEIGEDDIVRPSLSAAIEEDMEVLLTQIGFETVTEEVEIEPEVETVHDNNRPVGYEKVEEEGSPGLALVTYEIEYRNGEEVRRKELRRVVEKPAESRVVVVGNKPNYSGGPLNEEQITFLGNCESGMNPEAVSPPFPHRYYGAFQFRIDTWRSVNNTHSMPNEAPLAVQIEAVQTLLSRASIYTQFPSCARQMQAAGLL